MSLLLWAALRCSAPNMEKDETVDEPEPESAAPLSKKKRKSKPVRSRLVRPKKRGQYILKNLKEEEESRWCDSSSAQSSSQDESSQDESESLAGEQEDLHRSKSLVS